MTKKHFEIIALILAETLTSADRHTDLDQNSIGLDRALSILRSTNPRFNAGRFTEAVYDLASGRRPKGFSTALWGEYEARNRI
jgi:hypothetical protein